MRLERPDWMDDAACRDKPNAWWFPDPLTYGADFKHPEAVALCFDCPALMACREWGIAHEGEGLWGGLNPRERARIRRSTGVRLSVVEVDIDPLEERRRHAAGLWAAGWSTGEIAAELGHPIHQVRRWLQREGIDVSPPPWGGGGHWHDRERSLTA